VDFNARAPFVRLSDAEKAKIDRSKKRNNKSLLSSDRINLMNVRHYVFPYPSGFSIAVIFVPKHRDSIPELPRAITRQMFSPGLIHAPL
jgi:hypothetical protein